MTNRPLILRAIFTFALAMVLLATPTGAFMLPSEYIPIRTAFPLASPFVISGYVAAQVIDLLGWDPSQKKIQNTSPQDWMIWRDQASETQEQWNYLTADGSLLSHIMIIHQYTAASGYRTIYNWAVDDPNSMPEVSGWDWDIDRWNTQIGKSFESEYIQGTVTYSVVRRRRWTSIRVSPLVKLVYPTEIMITSNGDSWPYGSWYEDMVKNYWVGYTEIQLYYPYLANMDVTPGQPYNFTVYDDFSVTPVQIGLAQMNIETKMAAKAKE